MSSEKGGIEKDAKTLRFQKVDAEVMDIHTH